jgi:hypothetical protein
MEGWLSVFEVALLQKVVHLSRAVQHRPQVSAQAEAYSPLTRDECWRRPVRRAPRQVRGTGRRCSRFRYCLRSRNGKRTSEPADPAWNKCRRLRRLVRSGSGGPCLRWHGRARPPGPWRAARAGSPPGAGHRQEARNGPHILSIARLYYELQSRDRRESVFSYTRSAIHSSTGESTVVTRQ